MGPARWIALTALLALGAAIVGFWIKHRRDMLEFLAFIRMENAWWLIPVAGALFLVAALLLAGAIFPGLPLIYTIF